MKNKKGIALLMMLAMISLLAITVMICAFVLSYEVNKDERYDITRQRMLEVKRAFIGRLADVSGGEDITSCGGFINDYGEPDSITPFAAPHPAATNNFIGVLLNRESVATLVPPWPGAVVGWSYSGAPNEFWAGYRDERYLIPPAGEWDNNPPYPHNFYDGWGYPIEVEFPVAPSNSINIISRGSDGASGAVNPGSYDEDVVDTFYWRRPQVNVIVRNKVLGGVSLNVELIYPWQGSAQSEPLNHVFNLVDETHTFNFTDTAHGGAGIPVGLRKIVISDAGPPVVVKIIKMFCLPSGSGTYTMEQIDYSG